MPVRRVQCGPVRIDLGDDGGGRKRGQGAVEDRLAGRYAEGNGRGRHHKQRATDLQPSAQEYRARPLADMGKGKLEPHFEEQQGDADLGQKLHLVGRADQAESTGTHQNPGHQETHQGWRRQPVRQRNDGNRHADEQSQVDQQPCFGHVVVFSVPRAWPKLGRHATKISNTDRTRRPRRSPTRTRHVGRSVAAFLHRTAPAAAATR